MVSIITIDPDVHFDMRAHGAALLHLYHSHGFRLFTVLDERIQKLAFDRPATVINYNQLRNAIATPSTRKIYVQGFNVRFFIARFPKASYLLTCCIVLPSTVYWPTGGV